MTNAIYITIGIPFYNAESTLLDAVRSVFAQSHENWELILIDDGSTDRSLELAESIVDPRIRVVSDGQNKRLPTRLNQITELAKYDFIARMDADDLMDPEKISKQLKIFSEETVDLVSTGILSLNDKNEPVGTRCDTEGHFLTPKKVLLGQSGIVHASVVAKKSWYLRNPYCEDYYAAEDNELWVRAYSNSDLNIHFIPEPLYFYREDGSVTKEKLLHAYKLGRRILKENAKSNYTTSLKIYAYCRSYFKSLTVIALASSGKLEVIRQRRNCNISTDADKEIFRKKISTIKSFKLPLK